MNRRVKLVFLTVSTLVSLTNSHLLQAATECLIIANGTPIARKVLEALVPGKFKIALDGAADSLLLNYSPLAPDLILGDFDSISDQTFSGLWPNVPREHTPDQDYTDLEKGIQYCQGPKLNASAIWIVNALGLTRLDHTMANLNFLKKYYSYNRPIYLVSENEVIEFVRDGEVSFKGVAGQSVGVFGFPRARITSEGLQYPMYRYNVELGVSLSSSNYLAGEQGKIAVVGEALITYPHRYKD